MTIYLFGIELFIWLFNIFFAGSLLLKITLFLLHKDKKIAIDYSHIDLNNLPIYSILVPLYKENLKIIRQITQAISRLEYDKNRLDVKLIIEEDDIATYQNIQQLTLAPYFDIIKVPDSLPKTKPKACNHAMESIKGEYVTIYDAEDIPDPWQLLHSLSHFLQDKNNEIGAIQACLHFYNHKKNWLCNMFALEYRMLFNIFLPSMQANNLLIPLGGTSNHFRVKTLKEVGLWDAYNVTEDADLGVKLNRYGKKIITIYSETAEECPDNIRNWLLQRSRWIKGYMQTFIAHNQDSLLLLKQIGFKKFISMIFFILAPAIIFLSVPILIIIMLIYYFMNIAINPVLYDISMINLILNIEFHIYIAWLISWRYNYSKKYILSFPFYYLLHSIASYIALYELFFKPFKWHKTTHKGE